MESAFPGAGAGLLHTLNRTRVVGWSERVIVPNLISIWVHVLECTLSVLRGTFLHPNGYQR